MIIFLFLFAYLVAICLNSTGRFFQRAYILRHNSEYKHIK